MRARQLKLDFRLVPKPKVSHIVSNSVLDVSYLEALTELNPLRVADVWRDIKNNLQVRWRDSNTARF